MNNRIDIEKKTLEIIQTVTELESEITVDNSLFEELELSSLEVFTIFSEIEECFHIKIPENEIRKIVKVSDIVDLIIETLNEES